MLNRSVHALAAGKDTGMRFGVGFGFARASELRYVCGGKGCMWDNARRRLAKMVVVWPF